MRPGPAPSGRWLWSQSWERLLFVHWRVSPASLRSLIPDALEIDTFDGCAWVTQVPFRLGVRLRGTPEIPGLSRFAELNLRTYVRYRGRPGVWFLRIDADKLLAGWIARRLFYLPYVAGRVQLDVDGDTVRFRSSQAGATRFDATYCPTSVARPAAPGSLDEFLVERYRLYSMGRTGRPLASGSSPRAVAVAARGCTDPRQPRAARCRHRASGSGAMAPLRAADPERGLAADPLRRARPDQSSGRSPAWAILTSLGWKRAIGSTRSD